MFDLNYLFIQSRVNVEDLYDLRRYRVVVG